MQSKQFLFFLVIFCGFVACNSPAPKASTTSKNTQTTPAKSNSIAEKTTSAATGMQLVIDNYNNGGNPREMNAKQWSDAQNIQFIRGLDRGTEFKRMKELDILFDYKDLPRPTGKSAWFEKAIQNGYYIQIEEEIHPFVVNNDDIALILPIYQAYFNRNRMKTFNGLLDFGKKKYSAATVKAIEAIKTK